MSNYVNQQSINGNLKDYEPFLQPKFGTQMYLMLLLEGFQEALVWYTESLKTRLRGEEQLLHPSCSCLLWIITPCLTTTELKAFEKEDK
jgi:hypothetical protein